MRPARLFRALGDRLAATPKVGVALAVLLLAVSLALAIHNEQLSRAEKIREVEVQARILAGSLAGPLAFDDGNTVSEYLAALAANPEIEAVGAYDENGRLAASFARRDDAPPPARLGRLAPPRLQDNELVVTHPVSQGGTRLGAVYLRAATESLARRATRYLGIAAVLGMAALLIAVLGASYASLAAANRRLQEEIEGRRQAEDALRQAQKMEAMGQLTGGVAHDFNNLLMVASSALELMDRTTDPLRLERLKQGIRQAIDRGARLTQQLLTFARRSPLRPEVINIGHRIRGLQTMLDRSLRENIVVAADFPDGLWPVEVDPSQLDVAVLNIAINARDAMAGSGEIGIGAENLPGSDDVGDRVRVWVKDSGTGIPPDLLEKVFEPFFTTKGVGNGTGLGLSQVYGFVRSSGGEVAIESVLGKGTTVSLIFPRSSKPLPARRAPGRTAKAANDDMRVLIAEDDDTVAELVSEMLRELEYAPRRVSSAAAALAALDRGDRYDLVLSDMIMPGKMNGLELARAIVNRPEPLPVILMTGYSEAAASAAAEGIALLVKPYTLESLSEALRTALGR